MRGLLSVSTLLAAVAAATLVAAPAGAAAVPRCAGVPATIVGTSHADHLVGTSARDVIVAKGGADVIDGRGGNDLICAGGGRDVVLGGSGADEIYGGRGPDLLCGGPGQDILIGGSGADTLFGEGGDLPAGVEPHGVALPFAALVDAALPAAWDVEVDPGTRDLCLAPGSPAIDRGVWLPNLGDRAEVTDRVDLEAHERVGRRRCTGHGTEGTPTPHSRGYLSTKYLDK